MRLKLGFIIVLLITIMSVQGQSIFTESSKSVAITTTIVIPTATGNGYDMDIIVNNFVDVGCISLSLNYEQDHIIYQGITLNPAISSGMYNDLGGQIRIGWLAWNESQVVTLPSGTVLFTMHFDTEITSISHELVSTIFVWDIIAINNEYASYGGEVIYQGNFYGLNWSY